MVEKMVATMADKMAALKAESTVETMVGQMAASMGTYLADY